MNDKDRKNIMKIIHHIKLVNQYVSNVHSFEEFSKNQMVIDAVVFNLSQIGEIAKNGISIYLKSNLHSIPWNQIYGFRNRIIHNYQDVNMKIVYDTIHNDLSMLLKSFQLCLLNDEY